MEVQASVKYSASCDLDRSEHNSRFNIEQFHQQEREYEKNLQKIDADRQKIYEDPTVRLDNKTTKLDSGAESCSRIQVPPKHRGNPPRHEESPRVRTGEEHEIICHNSKCSPANA